jgi:hypothetical protein
MKIKISLVLYLPWQPLKQFLCKTALPNSQAAEKASKL